MRNPTEIAEEVVCSDYAGGHEGMSNRERFHYICAVFEVKAIRLGDTFDYDAVVASHDCELISAAIHLSILQHEWHTRCHLEGHFDEENHQAYVHFLAISRMKMRWAYSFLRFGKEPPTPTFIH